MGMTFVAFCLMGLLAVSLAQLPLGVVFTDINQGGSSYPMYGSVSDFSATPIGFDSISSMYFTVPGYLITIYSGVSFTGSSKVFRSTVAVPNLVSIPGWNDAIRSIQVTTITAGTPGLYLCTNYYLEGNCQYFVQGSVSDLTSTIGLNTASSAKVYAGTWARYYSGTYWTPLIGSPIFDAKILLSAGDTTYDTLSRNDEAQSTIVGHWPQPPSPPTPAPTYPPAVGAALQSFLATQAASQSLATTRKREWSKEKGGATTGAAPPRQ